MGDKQEPSEQTSAQSGTGTAAKNEGAQIFLAHLDYASRVVQTWPAWKQRVLGGTPVEPSTPQQGRNCLKG
jgi:hypothetical protein